MYHLLGKVMGKTSPESAYLRYKSLKIEKGYGHFTILLRRLAQNEDSCQIRQTISAEDGVGEAVKGVWNILE
jgi:hypothetical protein